MEKIHFEVIFCVFGCSTIKKYYDEILKISTTWGATAKLENYKVIFFLGEEPSSLKGDEYVYLENVKNDYFSASYKQNLGLLYILDNFTFNYVYVCGTDTFVNIKFLKQYLTTYNFNDKICIGGHGDYRTVQDKSIYYHSGGPGFIISYCAINEIKYLLCKMVEIWIDIVKSPNLFVACDLALCFFLSFHDCKFIVDDTTFFHCNHRGYPCHENNRMSKNVIAYHNMSLSDFDEYSLFINQDNFNDETMLDTHIII
jgi:hypothetical protein